MTGKLAAMPLWSVAHNAILYGIVAWYGLTVFHPRFNNQDFWRITGIAAGLIVSTTLFAILLAVGYAVGRALLRRGA